VRRLPAIALVVALFALPVVAPEHPRRPAADSVADYPLAVGMRWTYRTVGNVVAIREVTREVDLPGGRGFEMTYKLPLLGTRTVVMRRAAGGIETLEEGGPVLLLRFPMKPGDRWRIDLKGQDVADCEVMGEEIVPVLGTPTPTIRLKVVRTNRRSGKSTTDFEWYARGIGLVQMRVTFGLTATFALERFERLR
jgi:hypothetical protein